MNIQETRERLDQIHRCVGDSGCSFDYDYLYKFIDEVELLLKNNSIKQTPALFKPFDKGG